MLWAGLDMFFHLIEGNFQLASSGTAWTENLPECAVHLVFPELSKSEHLLAAVVLALMLHPLDQPGGEQGGAVAQVDNAGGALGHLGTGIKPDPVPTGSAQEVAVAADGHRPALPGIEKYHK